MKCKNCGSDAADGSIFCSQCGIRLSDVTDEITSAEENDKSILEAQEEFEVKSTCIENIPDESSEGTVEVPAVQGVSGEGENTEPTASVKKKNIAKILCVIVAAVVVIVIIVFFASTSSLSDEEKYAVEIVEKYQDILKDPDSLIIRSDIGIIEAYESDGWHDYCIFEASATNSFGASVQNVIIYKDGKYVEYVSDADEDDFDTLEEYKENARLYIVIWKYYMIGESDLEDDEDDYKCVIVDGGIIADKLGVEFSD